MAFANSNRETRPKEEGAFDEADDRAGPSLPAYSENHASGTLLNFREIRPALPHIAIIAALVGIRGPRVRLMIFVNSNRETRLG